MTIQHYIAIECDKCGLRSHHHEISDGSKAGRAASFFTEKELSKDGWIEVEGVRMVADYCPTCAPGVIHSRRLVCMNPAYPHRYQYPKKPSRLNLERFA